MNEFIHIHSIGDLGYITMEDAFWGCTNLISFGGGYTQNVLNMERMLQGTNSLTSLDLSSFNTSNVTDMSGMFQSASSLTSLNLTNWDTSGGPVVTNWLNGSSPTILCNDPDGGGVGAPGTGTVNGETCN